MKICKTYREFFYKVGILVDLKYSYGIDLEPCWGVVGFFKQHRLEELLAFVEKYPEYHIVSELGNNIFFNKVIQNRFGYFLAEGDQDPEIVYLGVIDPVRDFDYEVRRLMSNSGFPIFLKDKSFSEF